MNRLSLVIAVFVALLASHSAVYYKGWYDHALKTKTASASLKIENLDNQVRDEIGIDQSKQNILKDIRYVETGTCHTPKLDAALVRMQQHLDAVREDVPDVAGRDR